MIAPSEAGPALVLVLAVPVTALALRHWDPDRIRRRVHRRRIHAARRSNTPKGSTR
ncbi:hypothetical protein [Kitasatospora sp. MBT66]|uniref:hypothetical protein n=1 Tax=Kitasatospora sp. MBT66 TaxID=1444769 RepID=UPI000B2684FF|nr:hypothetical protein [Kitasatospora sp. MBT66]